METLIEICIAMSSDNTQLLQCYFAAYRQNLEEVVFVNEEFLHKKISNKDIYMEYVLPWLISQKMQSINFN